MANQDFKQVIVVRNDLKMGKGKIAVQVAHGAVTAAELAKRQYKKWYSSWVFSGQAKVAVKAQTLDDLIKINSKLSKMDIPSYLVEDRGLTQVSPGTITCLAIGPAPSHILDEITGDLKLL